MTIPLPGIQRSPRYSLMLLLQSYFPLFSYSFLAPDTPAKPSVPSRSGLRLCPCCSPRMPLSHLPTCCHPVRIGWVVLWEQTVPNSQWLTQHKLLLAQVICPSRTGRRILLHVSLPQGFRLREPLPYGMLLVRVAGGREHENWLSTLCSLSLDHN